MVSALAMSLQVDGCGSFMGKGVSKGCCISPQRLSARRPGPVRSGSNVGARKAILSPTRSLETASKTNAVRFETCQRARQQRRTTSTYAESPSSGSGGGGGGGGGEEQRRDSNGNNGENNENNSEGWSGWWDKYSEDVSTVAIALAASLAFRS